MTEKTKEILNKIVLAERKYDLSFSNYIVCKLCKTIAYGDGNCHCGKNEWSFWESDFNKRIKEERKNDRKN